MKLIIDDVSLVKYMNDVNIEIYEGSCKIGLRPKETQKDYANVKAILDTNDLTVEYYFVDIHSNEFSQIRIDVDSFKKLQSTVETMIEEIKRKKENKCGRV